MKRWGIAILLAVVVVAAVAVYVIATQDDEDEKPALPTVGALTLGPAETIRLEEGVYWVDDAAGQFTVTVEATNATRVEFFTRGAGGDVVPLGVDDDGSDGWSLQAGLEPDYRGSVYAEVYNAAGDHVRSEELAVAR